MKYRVFNTMTEVAEANGRWLYARSLASEYDKKRNKPVNPQVTSAWHYGLLMKDGRIACNIPPKWGKEFGGIELILNKEDFVEKEEVF